MKQYYFCSYFDSNYLAHGLTLIRSLEKECEVPFVFYVLCLDEKTYALISKLQIKSVKLIKLSEIENWEPRLIEAKKNRSLVEYFFTLSPLLPLFILKFFKVDIIACLDADLMFFSSPTAIYDELGLKSIYIIEHRFRPNFKSNIISGRFNVQCQLFRNNKAGLHCLSLWRDQCLDWCYDRFEDGKFGDQKYLDEWPSKYKDDLVISTNLGVGVAVWNVDGENIIYLNNVFFINGDRVIFFHFHGLKVFNRFMAKTGLSAYKTPISKALRELYIVYISNLFLNNFQANKKSIRVENYGLLRTLLSGFRHQDIIIKLNKF